MTTAKPIIFSKPMVQALLAGTKTQTRRICKDPDRCPFAVGDVAWVREALVPSSEGWTRYEADGLPTRVPRHWKATASRSPGMLMPREQSRLSLIITNVRAERVGAISSADAIAEGVRGRESFVTLWDTLNGHRADCRWADDPVVWAFEFRAEHRHFAELI